MTALSEALLTAQRGALAAMQKAYLRGMLGEEDLVTKLHVIGCADESDLMLYVASLNVMAELGADAQTNGGAAAKPPAEDEPASEAQWKLLRKLADEQGRMAPDPPLTKGEASRHIDALKSGAPF